MDSQCKPLPYSHDMIMAFKNHAGWSLEIFVDSCTTYGVLVDHSVNWLRNTSVFTLCFHSHFSSVPCIYWGVGKSCLPNKLLALKFSFVLTSSVLSADNVFKCLCEDVTAPDLVGKTLSFGGQKHSMPNPSFPERLFLLGPERANNYGRFWMWTWTLHADHVITFSLFLICFQWAIFLGIKDLCVHHSVKGKLLLILKETWDRRAQTLNIMLVTVADTNHLKFSGLKQWLSLCSSVRDLGRAW